MSICYPETVYGLKIRNAISLHPENSNKLLTEQIGSQAQTFQEFIKVPVCHLWGSIK